MNSELGKQSLPVNPELEVAVNARDAVWSNAIIDGVTADIEARNHWDEMLPEERETALSKVQVGEKAQQEMYNAYSELPSRVLSKMVEDKILPSVARDEDLGSVSVLGMFDAMRSWDSSGNVNFRTYATRVIRNSVMTYFAENSAYGGLPRLHHQNRAVYEATGGEMNKDGALIRLNIGPDEQIAVLPKGWSPESAQHFSPEKYLEFLEIFSKSAQTNPPDDMSLGDYLDSLIASDRLLNGGRASTNFVDTSNEDVAARKALRESVSKAVSQLDPRCQDVIRIYFGLTDGERKTLGETTEIMGHGHLTRENVRLLLARAMAILRHPDHVPQLKTFIRPEN